MLDTSIIHIILKVNSQLKNYSGLQNSTGKDILEKDFWKWLQIQPRLWFQVRNYGASFKKTPDMVLVLAVTCTECARPSSRDVLQNVL